MIGVGWRGCLALLTYSERVRRRRIRPPVSSARPPSRTGMAAKPVNGSSLLVAAASWRVGCVSLASAVASAGRTPPAGAGADGVLDGLFSASAGSTPPSGVEVGVGVTVLYSATDACVWLAPPFMARPAPAVLKIMPATSMLRIATRDF